MGTHLAVETLGLDLEVNGGNDQLMIRLMVDAPKDSRVKQVGSTFPVNKY